MDKILTHIVQSLVENKDEVSVEKTTENNHTTLTISVHDNDIGKVIGKNGRIIRAIRDVIKIVAVKQNTYVDVVLKEENFQQK